MRTPVSSFAALAFAMLGACTIGDTNADDSSDGTTDTDGTSPDANGGGADASATPKVTATVSPPTQMTELRTSGALAAGNQEVINGLNRFDVDVLSEGGFTGQVAFAVSGLGTGWTATFDPATVSLTDGGTASTTLRIDIASDAEAATKALSITATSTAPDETKAVTMTAAAVVTIGDTIPFPVVTIKQGTEFRIRNDSDPAQNNRMIHGPGNQDHATDPNDSTNTGAFPHESTGGAGHAQGDYYAVKPDQGTFSWYGHNFGSAGDAVNLTVTAP